MKKFKLSQSAQNSISIIHPYGTNLLYYRNPYMVAWWSAAFPGFGHILLGDYVKGIVFFLWEMAVNQGSHLNLGLVATLQGHFNQAKTLLNPVLILNYIPVYLFAIWDSLRSTIDINHSVEAQLKHFRPFRTLASGTIGVNVFEKKPTGIALFWSFLSPGTGQFYLHRTLEAFFFMVWFLVICYYSHFFEGVLYLLRGELVLSNRVYNIQWFMFLPSIFFFSAYNAYADAYETNIIYQLNQTQKLQQCYQHPDFHVEFPKNKINA